MSRRRALIPGLYVLCATIVAVPASAAPRAPIFPNPVADTDDLPTSVALGDFDGDGILDAAVATKGTDAVDVLLGNGDGTFEAAVSYPAGVDPLQVFAGDFNSDGTIDLLTRTTASVAMLPGNADGTFGPATISMPIGGTAMASGDLDGDGAPDLALSWRPPRPTGEVCVAINLAGSGSFGSPVCQSTAFSPQSVTIADFNRDGKADLAVGGETDVAIHLGLGGGVFSGPQILATTTRNDSITSADMNRDGHLDLLSAYVTQYPTPGAPDGFVRVLLGNGLGQFSHFGDFLNIGFARIVTTGDFNGDGIPDVATGGATAAITGIDVLPGLGDGSLGVARHYDAGMDSTALAVGDLNRDGRPDIAAAVRGDFEQGTFPRFDGLVAFISRPDGTFAQPRFGDGGDNEGIASVDLNADGHTDLVVVERYFNRVSVLLGQGDGSFADLRSFPSGVEPRGIAVGDFDGNGTPDVATALNYGVAVLLGSGDGTLGPAVLFPGGNSFYDHFSIVTADFTGDGILDLATPNIVDVSIFTGFGNGQFSGHTRYFPGSSAVELAAGDVDGDLIPDLVMGRSGMSGGLTIQYGNGNGTFASPVHLSGPPGAAILISDFNGDGVMDLASSSNSSNGSDELSLFLGLGGRAFGSRQALPCGSVSRPIAAGDINRDGNLDLVAGNLNSNDMGILLGDGAGGFAPVLRYASLNPSRIALGDFDEDGWPDVAVGTGSASASLLINQLGPPSGSDPIADAGPDQTAECGASPSGSLVPVDGSASTDPDSTPGSNDDIALFQWFLHYGEPGETLLAGGETTSISLPLGTHTVTLKVTDETDRTATDVVIITVADAQPPTVTVSLDPTALWPPNHRMLAVAANVEVSDACGPVSVYLEGVASSESDDDPGNGDGATTGDIAGAAIGTFDTAFSLRAERASPGPGRTYTATYRVTDSQGRSTLGTATVSVPHDIGGVTDPISIRLRETPAGTLVEWDPVPGAVAYSVAAGILERLITLDPSPDGQAPVCYQGHSAATSTAGFEIPDNPDPGSAWFFVVDFVDAFGRLSGYGSESCAFDLDPVVHPNICAGH